MTTTRFNYSPHDGQRKLHAARTWARRIYAKVGRRWGKSRFGVGDLVEVYNNLLSVHRDESLIPPFDAWLLVPSKSQGEQTWTELMQLLPEHIVEQYHETDKSISLKGNDNWQRRSGRFTIKTAANPAALQTVGLDYLWLQESQDIPDEAQEKVWPTLASPGRLGFVLAEGIPALRRDHWFERGCAEAERRMKEGQHRGYFYYNATTFENPLLTPRELEEIEDDRDFLSPSAWERMYMARFNETAGFFENVDGCIGGDELSEPIIGASYGAGLDFGRGADPTVLYVMDTVKRRVVLRREWTSETPTPIIIATLEQLHDIWAFQHFVYDATAMGGKMLGEHLSDTGIPVTPYDMTGARRQELLEHLAGAIARGTITYPPIKQLVKQLHSFEHRRISGNRYMIAVPSGHHDDDVFALAMALRTCDPPHPIARANGRSRNGTGRYLPTQAEADGAGIYRSQGRRIMRERREARMLQRAMVAGVEL